MSVPVIWGGQVSGVGAFELAQSSFLEKSSLPCSLPTGSSIDPNLPRSVSVASGLNMVKKQKVKTIFPHTAGTNQTLLGFAQGDVITLLISEEKDGWLYGEHDSTKMWVPGWVVHTPRAPVEAVLEGR